MNTKVDPIAFCIDVIQLHGTKTATEYAEAARDKYQIILMAHYSDRTTNGIMRKALRKIAACSSDEVVRKIALEALS